MSEWTYYRIKGTGLSAALYQRWPIETTGDARAGIVWQIVGEKQGNVFLRYGKETSIEVFVDAQQDAVTRVTVLEEQPLDYRGHPARRVSLRLNKDSLRVYREIDRQDLVHNDLPPETWYVSVIGFEHRGMSVLVGYRVTEIALMCYRSVLERILINISFNPVSIEQSKQDS